MEELRFPLEMDFTSLTGEVKTYVLHKFHTVAGREIVAKYPLSSMPKLGDYKVNEETMFKLMAYVGIKVSDGNVIMLKTRALIDNHVPDWETLAKIEFEMMRYNTSFFDKGKVLGFLKGNVLTFLQSTLPTLKPLLQQLSKTAKQASKS